MKRAAVMRDPLAAGDSMPSMANAVKHTRPYTQCNSDITK